MNRICFARIRTNRSTEHNAQSTSTGFSPQTLHLILDARYTAYPLQGANPVAGTWHYSYTFSGTVTTGGKNLDHFIADTSDSCINVAAGTPADPNCITNVTISDGSMGLAPGDYKAGSSNPNFRPE